MKAGNALSLDVRFPCSPRYAAAARQAFRVHVAPLQLNSAAQSELEVAIGEGIANVVEHGFGKATFFELRCRVERGVIKVEIEDRGRDQEAGKHLERTETSRTLGFAIMQSLVDHLEFLDDGRLVRFSKKIT
jgi:anti-sigma regulatory factor (Ser/Thr protein kinase)